MWDGHRAVPFSWVRRFVACQFRAQRGMVPLAGNSARRFFDKMEMMMITPNGNRWNVFVLESGDFVWVGAADTREGAIELLEHHRDNRGVEYGFLAEMEVFEFFGTESEVDTSALRPDELAVGIRHANGIADRTPANIVSAIAALRQELTDLVGDDADNLIQRALEG